MDYEYIFSLFDEYLALLVDSKNDESISDSMLSIIDDRFDSILLFRDWLRWRIEEDNL